MIIGHGLGEDGIQLAADTPNVYLELSGSYPNRGMLRRAIDTVGADRIVFGTDMDLIVPAFALGIYQDADLSPEEDRLLMAENARRILRTPRRIVDPGTCAQIPHPNGEGAVLQVQAGWKPAPTRRRPVDMTLNVEIVNLGCARALDRRACVC